MSGKTDVQPEACLVDVSWVGADAKCDVENGTVCWLRAFTRLRFWCVECDQEECYYLCPECYERLRYRGLTHWCGTEYTWREA